MIEAGGGKMIDMIRIIYTYVFISLILFVSFI